MKKILVGILTASIVLTAGTAGVMAAGSTNENTASAVRGSVKCNTLSTACQYTDTDYDGLCDNLGTDCSNDCDYTESTHHDTHDNHNSNECRRNSHTQEHGHRGNHHR